MKAVNQTESSKKTLVFYATRSGGYTLDTGESGGNPFASALIEVAGDASIRLKDLPGQLGDLTTEKSRGHQVIEWHGDLHLPDWRFRQEDCMGREKRRALVLVVSDYSGTDLDTPLAGAARDERRIAAMLARSGFSVEQGIGRRRQDLIGALESFRHRSKDSEIAVIYSTGHGFESGGEVFLVPGDYPSGKQYGRAQLRDHAVSISWIIDVPSACGQNIVFFAGCRTPADDLDPAPSLKSA